MKLALHNYWRSSASHRVRIALNLKKLAYEYVAVNILKREQQTDAYRAKNPMSQVPTLEITDDDGTRRAISQSLPIMEYLEDRWPHVPILPNDLYQRACSRSLAEIINSGIQPLQNLTTTNKVKSLGGDDAAWVRGFVADGLAAFSGALAGAQAVDPFCVGEFPTIADCCLVPQLASARRFGVELADHPRLLEIEARCLDLPAFADAMPDRQPDAVPVK